jgi:hypothetical protein
MLMSTVWKTASQPVAIERSAAVFTEIGNTAPTLDIRNTQSSPILGSYGWCCLNDSRVVSGYRSLWP